MNSKARQLSGLLKTIFFCFMILIVIACTGDDGEDVEGTPTPEPTEVAAAKAIVLGDISDDPGEVIEGTQPLADYLAANLTDFGITEGRVKVAETADEMIELLKNGEVDIYFDSVYPATVISDASGGHPFLRRWRFGVEEYYAVIFTGDDGQVTSLDDLVGKMVAFDNPFSTSGFVLPAVHLIQQGYTLTGKSSFDDAVEDDEIGFVFSYDDENTLQWVLTDSVAAGATDDYNFNIGFPEENRANLISLAQTDSVPRQVAVARPDIEQDYLDAIAQILVNAHETEEGQAALEPFQTTRFDEFPEGIDSAGEEMRSMIDIIEGIPLPPE